MHVLAGNKNNIFTWAFSASGKTLIISNCINFDLSVASLYSIYNSTRSLPFIINSQTTCTKGTSGGLTTWTFTFSSVPAASADADVLIIVLDIPQSQAEYSLLLYMAGATI